MAEKQFLADIVQKVSQMEDEKSYTKVGDSEFGQDDEFEELDLIRTEFRNYLNQLLKTMSKLKRCVGDFDTLFSPQNCLADDLQKDKANPMLYEK